MSNKDKLKSEVLYWVNLLEVDIYTDRDRGVTDFLHEYSDIGLIKDISRENARSCPSLKERREILNYIEKCASNTVYICNSQKKYIGAEFRVSNIFNCTCEDDFKFDTFYIEINTRFNKVKGLHLRGLEETEEFSFTYNDKVGLNNFYRYLYESTE